MTISSAKINRLVIAGALASGLLSAGVAASAQTSDAVASQQTMTAGGPNQATGATNISLSSADTKAERQAGFERTSAEEHRRMLFRNQGTSL